MYTSALDCLQFVPAKGVARGGPGVPVTSPLVSLFKRTTYNRWRKRHDNLVCTLTLTRCDPPWKNPGYAPGSCSGVLSTWRLHPEGVPLSGFRSSYKKVGISHINPLLPKRDLQILLCLTPDDFTRQREAPWAVKG